MGFKEWIFTRWKGLVIVAATYGLAFLLTMVTVSLSSAYLSELAFIPLIIPITPILFLTLGLLLGGTSSKRKILICILLKLIQIWLQG